MTYGMVYNDFKQWAERDLGCKIENMLWQRKISTSSTFTPVRSGAMADATVLTNETWASAVFVGTVANNIHRYLSKACDFLQLMCHLALLCKFGSLYFSNQSESLLSIAYAFRCHNENDLWWWATFDPQDLKSYLDMCRESDFHSSHL